MACKLHVWLVSLKSSVRKWTAERRGTNLSQGTRQNKKEPGKELSALGCGRWLEGDTVGSSPAELLGVEQFMVLLRCLQSESLCWAAGASPAVSAGCSRAVEPSEAGKGAQG